MIQSWDGLVYHFTSRGSRFNKHAGGAAGKNSSEWLYTTTKNGKNFIRKWGHFVKHDSLMKPIIPPKYDIGFVLYNCTMEHLSALEPWCTKVYVENTEGLIDHYIANEQPNTSIDLRTRVMSIEYNEAIHYNDIVVTIDCKNFTNQDFEYIQLLPELIKETNDLGVFKIGVQENLKIEIQNLSEYQNQLIVCKK